MKNFIFISFILCSFVIRRIILNSFLRHTDLNPDNNNKLSSNYWPKLASLYDYGFILVWVDSIPSVRAQIFNLDKSKKGPSILIDNSKFGYWPSVSGYKNGDFIVLYADNETKSNLFKIHVIKFDMNGVYKSCIENVVDFLSVYTSCAVLEEENYFVILLTGNQSLEFAIYDRDMAIVVGNTCVTCNDYNKLQADVGALSDGNFVIVVDVNKKTNSFWDIYARVYKYDGSPLTDVFIVNSVTSGDQTLPSVSGLKNGGFVITWNNGVKVSARIYDSKYNPIGEEFNVNSILSSDKSHYPSITSLETGGFVISFGIYISQTSYWNIYAREFDENGDSLTISEYITIAHTNVVQGYSNIKSTKSEKYVVAYTCSDDSEIRLENASDFQQISCNNFTIKINPENNSTFHINFLNQIYSKSEDKSNIKIILKSSPSDGVLKKFDDNTALNIGSEYSYEMINYFPGISTSVTLTYSIFDNKIGESDNCNVTINVCYESCQTCSKIGNLDSHMCDTCELNYFSLSDLSSQCFMSNSDVNGYFFNKNFFDRCPLNCKKCESISKCLKCDVDYFIFPEENNCVNSCPDSYYPDYDTRTCFPCIENCRYCNNNFECLVCNEDFYLHELVDKHCYKACPDGYYLNKLSSSNTCEECPKNCKLCDNNSECILCFDNYYLHFTRDKKCYSKCGDGFYENPITKRCEECSSHCEKCINESICNSCKENFYLNENNCVSQCPLHLFPDAISRKCLNCVRECGQCADESRDLLCVEKYYLHIIDCDCYNPCPLGYFGNVITKLCDKCNYNCTSCLNKEECLKCDDEYYLHYKVNNQCYSKCPAGFFEDISTYKCEPCPLYFIYETNICVAECPKNYFLDTSKNSCKKCPLYCDLCSNEDECDMCSLNYFNIQKENCIDKSIDGYYTDLKTRKFIPCGGNCEICSDSSKCDKCFQNFFLLDKNINDCVICSDGFYGNIETQLCESCNTNCAICKNTQECLKCETNFFLLENRCVEVCPGGYYKNNTLSTCSKCREVCSECHDDSDNCTVCTETSYVAIDSENNIKRCVATCPIETHLSENRQCIGCKEEEKFWNKNQCVNQCDEGYYKNIEFAECVLCDKQGEYKNLETCVSNCPENSTINEENECIPCEEICLNESTCSIENDKVICLCKDNFVGEFCEIENSIISQITNTNEPISEETLKLLNNLKTTIQNNPLKALPEITKKISDIAIMKLDEVKSGKIPPHSDILNVFSTALRLNSITKQSNRMNPTVNIENLKNNVSEFVDIMLNKTSLQDHNLFISSEFSIQLTSTDMLSMQKTLEISRKYNLSVVNATECENELKNMYNIPKDIPLIMKKIDISSSLNTTKTNGRERSDSIIFQFYHPITKEKLDLSACKKVNTIIKTANRRINTRINAKSYKRLSISGLSMFNKSSLGYFDRCIPILDPEKNLDTTLMFRILNYYQNMTIICLNNCTFDGLDDNGMVICNCSNITNTEQPSFEIVDDVVNITDIKLKMPRMNFDIFLCFTQVLKYPRIFSNPAFYIGALFLITGWVFYFILRFESFKLIEKNVYEIVDNDCLFFDTENMSVEEYFQYNSLKKKKDPNNFRKLRGNIDFVDPKNNAFRTMSTRFFSMNILKIKKSITPQKVAAPFEKTSENKTDNKNIDDKKQEISSMKGLNVDYQEKLKRNFTKSLEWKTRNQKIDVSSSSRLYLNKDPSPIEDIKIYKHRPYKVGVYFKFPDHVPTKKDFECLSPFKAVVCDDRPFKVLLIFFLIEDHALFNIIFKKSLFNPRWAEIFFLCFTYSLLFAVNALFYTDSYIDAAFDRTGNV